MQPIVFALFALMAALAYVRPRAGLAFMWFAIWLYPVKGMYGTLPFDIRLSDLWVVYMACLALLHGDPSVRRSWPIRLAVFWFLAMLAGNLSGWALGGFGNVTPLLKEGLKVGYVPCTALAVSSFLSTERDIRNHIAWLTSAITAASALSLLMMVFPHTFDAFLIPKQRLIWQSDWITSVDMVERRAIGTMGKVALGQVTLVGVVLAASQATGKLSAHRRALYVLAGMTSYVALVCTVSRGCLTALAVSVSVVFFATRRRVGTLAVAVLALTTLALSVPLAERVRSGFSGEQGGFSAFQQGVQTRLDIVRYFADTASWTYFLFGEGTAGGLHYGGTTHNAYIGAVVYCGMPGVALLVAMIVRGWSMGTRLVRFAPDPLSQSLGWFLQVLVLAFAVYGLSAENFFTVVPMQLYFAALVMAHNRLAAPWWARGVIPARAGRRYVRLSAPDHDVHHGHPPWPGTPHPAEPVPATHRASTAV